MKKLRRIGSLLTALALVLSLTVLGAAAVSFTDMQGHWARQDVEELASAGIITAILMGPSSRTPRCQRRKHCSSAPGWTNISADIESNVAQKYNDTLSEMLPEVMRSWAIPELAVCLETGIITEAELSAMCTSGAISQAITREDLSVYLVRAMQLEPMAKTLSAYSLPFDDTDQIARQMMPYVYLLYTYGVVGGNENNEFMPDSTISRAEMAVMLKRALDFMDSHGVVVELPDYTDNDWLAVWLPLLSLAATGLFCSR